MEQLGHWLTACAGDLKATVRLRQDKGRSFLIRDGVMQAPSISERGGAMVTVWYGQGMGYAALSDLNESGMAEAFERALSWAKRCDQASVFDFSKETIPEGQHEYLGPAGPEWTQGLIKEVIEGLKVIDQNLDIDPKVVSRFVNLRHVDREQWLYSSVGGCVYQHLSMMVPDFEVAVYEAGDTQRRSLGGRGACQQGGMEAVDLPRLQSLASLRVEQALELLAAPNCPTEVCDVLLSPDQMILQIHESIGHPLELDRILGDERNYAGTSFVTEDMFGSFQYGSGLLNVSFDPTIREQFASYGYDDDGTPAEKVMIIEDGTLKTPLGAALSQLRSGMSGVANSRVCDWNRPSMDRMANLNLEPGESGMDEMIASVERGVYMQTNCSWSIDDSRNKFQFGCEYGQMIENGELTHVVKNPNYRGISREFWRKLKAVGVPETVEVMGTPYCGKGEPNQMIEVGHASPTCLFESVEVFGGAE